MMSDVVKFSITTKNKKKARRRRIRNESKWLVLRILSVIFFAVFIITYVLPFFLEVFTLENELILPFVGSAGLILAVICRALIWNLADHWIGDRLNEKIVIRDGKIYHFIQKAFASGINYRSSDERATMYVIDLDSIRNARYDPKSGRMEFNAIGKGIRYADYQIGKIEKDWELPPEFTGIFYDYMEPSLYNILCSMGVDFKEETINFSLNDWRI